MSELIGRFNSILFSMHLYAIYLYFRSTESFYDWFNYMGLWNLLICFWFLKNNIYRSTSQENTDTSF